MEDRHTQGQYSMDFFYKSPLLILMILIYTRNDYFTSKTQENN